MKSKQSLKEAIFRSHQSIEKSTQPQEQLYNMTRPNQDTKQSGFSPKQVELNESPKNLMQSWMTLRSMDGAIADKLKKAS